VAVKAIAVKPPWSIPANRRGFTLVEVMAVAVVMALLAGAAALTFAGPLRRATAREAVDRVASFDESCRRYATRFDRNAEMVFSLADGTMALRLVGAARGGPRPARLPSGVRFNRIRVAGDRGRNAAFGEVSVPCSSLGTGISYAVELTGPGFDRWIVVAGLGGGATEVSDEHEVDRILAALARPSDPAGNAPRDDAR
jgi:prepilin-type N-terminal cleavage/methylation domain-containing protein